ncbi:MAG: Ribonuclease HII [Synergistales bacterium 53_16]|nr:MAG: Ribonuclease HII [Synergistales bacterium 53_16]
MIVAGVDEAGRGPLAGPVVAAAVVLSREEREHLVAVGLKDSKKLTPSRREKIFCAMLEMGIVWRAQAASPARIDRDNILRASLWAMARSVSCLPVLPDLVVVDGNIPIPLRGLKQKTLVAADDKVPAVAAASVIAKVLRDRTMAAFAKRYPDYGFERNKGYPSREHREVLERMGPCPLHRRTFGPCGNRR